MNLYINLIKEDEKRHGGAIPLMFIIRSAGITIALLLLLFVSYLLITLNLSRNLLTRTEERIADKKPQLALSGQIMKQQKVYRDMLAQLDGWKSMRLDWNQQLATLRETVPLDVQLASLRLIRVLSVTNDMPVTTYSLVIRGKTGGATPEANLTRFRQNMQKTPAFTNDIDEVSVPEGAFVEDTTPGANIMDRLFEINCRYRPRETR